MKLAGGYSSSTDDDPNWSPIIPGESRKHLKARKRERLLSAEQMGGVYV